MNASFDRIVIVDWSANSAPKSGKDSIWAAEARPGDRTIRSTNLPTRDEAMVLLRHIAAQPGRLLIGVDFSLGFVAGTSNALGLRAPTWGPMWTELARLISDDPQNRNNRFEVAADLNARMGPGPGPFWGCPPAKAGEYLTTTKRPSDPLSQWRTVEARLRDRNHQPFSGWQLTGAGSVGSQSLLGIARMHALVNDVRSSGRTMDVWPFTSGLEHPTADVVLVEVWPSLVDLPDVSDDPWDRRVRDQLQVETLAAHLAGRELGPLFTPEVDSDAAALVCTEEGWVFGVE